MFSMIFPAELATILKNGGAGRDRTDDLLLAKQALSQLSYSPLKFIAKFKAAKS